MSAVAEPDRNQNLIHRVGLGPPATRRVGGL